MFRQYVTVGLLALCMISMTCSVEAQSTFGSIVGVVKDPSGLVMPGAQLTLSGLDDQSTRTAVSDADGSFQFMNVKAGRYEIAVQAAGFASFKLQSVQLESRPSKPTSVVRRLTMGAGSRRHRSGIHRDSMATAIAQLWSPRTNHRPEE
jgi:carboxypeptidase family protein